MKCIVLSIVLGVAVTGCTVHREVTMMGGGYPGPIRGYLEGKLGSEQGRIYVGMPDGETYAGEVTFYWGPGGQRMCRGILLGTSGAKLECSATVNPNTAHGVGECTGDGNRKFAWQF